MNIRVFSRTANPAVDRPLYSLKKREAPDGFFLVEVGEFCGIGRFLKISRSAVQLNQRYATEPEPMAIYVNGPFGVGNMVPFSRVPDKLRQPQKLHYQIPACGAHGRLLVVANVNFEPAVSVL